MRALQEEDRRNILHRYCRKVEYYEEMGSITHIAIIKAKEFYRIKS